MKTWWMVGLFALAAACGKDENKAPAAGGDGAARTAAKESGPAKADPAPKPDNAAEKRREKVATLTAKRDELAARVKDTKAQLDGIDQKHEKEREGLPDLRKLRRRFVQLQRDANIAASTYGTLKKQYDELKAYADTAVTGELKQLREQMKEVEERYDKAQSGWRQAMEEERQNIVNVHTAARQTLDLCRSIKAKWFEVTPEARRGTATGAQKEEINSTFRGWLKAEEPRRALCARILGQEIAPKGKTPDSYDFSDLEFFILLEVMEDALDRENLAVEKKELKETGAKLEEIEKEIDVLREKIAQKMQQGGGKLELYEDVKSRIGTARDKARDLQTQVTEYQKTFAEIDELRERQEKEANELSDAYEAAQRELAQITRDLRAVGG